MKLEVLVATMGKPDFDKVEKMHIHTDVVYANQSDETSYLEKKYDFGTAKIVSTTTRGVGKNRNISLLYSSGDILLFSDTDLRYVSNYDEIILKAFEEAPDADAFVFNILPCDVSTQRRVANKLHRVRWYECLNYGTVRLAIRRKSIMRENIFFNLNFGGGTSFSAGEDSIFISDLIKHKLKIYAYPEIIGEVDSSHQSTWFKGYNEKYFYDKGILFKTISKRYAKLLCLQDLIRHKNYKEGNLTFKQAYKCMKEGIKSYKDLKPFK